MNNTELAARLNKILVGQEGIATFEFEGESNPKAPKSLGVFEEIEAPDSNVFLKFSGKTVAVFTPLFVLTIVAERNGSSWTAEDICSNLYIGGKSFRQILKEA